MDREEIGNSLLHIARQEIDEADFTVIMKTILAPLLKYIDNNPTTAFLILTALQMHIQDIQNELIKAVNVEVNTDLN